MKKIMFVIILSGLLLCCSGCFGTSADFNYIEDSIQSQIYPANLDTDLKFSIGSLSMGMISGFIDDKEEANAYLKEIKTVQVGIYKIHNPEKSSSFRIPHKVEQSMFKKGWEPFVHVRSRKGENVSLYFRQVSAKQASIYMIVLEPGELVIVEINGKLDKVIEKALCEHNLPGVDRL